jgi:hypothetical protein
MTRKRRKKHLEFQGIHAQFLTVYFVTYIFTNHYELNQLIADSWQPQLSEEFHGKIYSYTDRFFHICESFIFLCSFTFLGSLVK